MSYTTPPGWDIVEVNTSNPDYIIRVHAWQNPLGTALVDPFGGTNALDSTLVQGMTSLTGQSQPAGAGCGPSRRTLTYDNQRNTQTSTDFNGNLTTYTYDLGRNIETRRVEASGTAFARTINTTWHPDWRLVSGVAEPLKTTLLVYQGQPDPSNANVAANCVNQTAQLPSGRALAVLCKRIEQSTTDVSGSQGFGATLAGPPRVWQWTYNADGQVLSAKGPRTDVNDTTTYVYRPADDTGTPMRYRRGDLYTVTDAANHTTTMLEYDGNGRVTKMSDANSVVTTMSYTPRGWLSSSTVTAGGVSEITRYEYDPVGQLKKATQPDNSFVLYDYDGAHRLVKVTDGLGNYIAYRLDAMGNRLQEQAKDPSGTLAKNITRVYDALNRLQTVTGALE